MILVFYLIVISQDIAPFTNVFKQTVRRYCSCAIMLYFTASEIMNLYNNGRNIA